MFTKFLKYIQSLFFNKHNHHNSDNFNIEFELSVLIDYNSIIML